MGVIQMDFLAESLNIATSVHIILPMPRHAGVQVKPLPTLILLHGMGDDDSAWLRKSNIERFATEAGLAVIMPDGELSCYENMVHGQKYADFITKELPAVMRACFPLSDRRDENFIAGCSMGGCGALKLGLAAPENWSVIGAFSAGHLEYRPDAPRNRAMLRSAFGDSIAEADARIERNAMNPEKPPLAIYQFCGDTDMLRETTVASAQFLSKQPGITHELQILPGGHDWALWDEAVRRFIARLPLKKPEVRLL